MRIKLFNEWSSFITITFMSMVGVPLFFFWQDSVALRLLMGAWVIVFGAMLAGFLSPPSPLLNLRRLLVRPGDQIAYWWIDGNEKMVTEIASVSEVYFLKRRNKAPTVLNVFLIMDSPNGAWNCRVFKEGKPRDVPLSMIALK